MHHNSSGLSSVWLEQTVVPREFEMLLADLAENVPDIFFLEIGAMDGKSFDSLYASARKHRWRGLLIEPLPDLFERLKTNYDNDPRLIFENVAISDVEETRTLYRVPLATVESGSVPGWAAGISSFYRDRNAIGGLRTRSEDYAVIRPYITEQPVACHPLQTILDRHRIAKIDLVQIDVEGYDYHVLKQLDLNRYRPYVIHFESYNLPDDELHAALDRLQKFGYECYSDGMNVTASLPMERKLEEAGDGLTTDTIRPPAAPPRKLNAPKKFKKVLFFMDSEWAFGSINSELIKYLHERRIIGDIWDWKNSPSAEVMSLIVDNYDYIVTIPGASWPLTDTYGVGHDRIVIVAHGEFDLGKALRTRPPDEFERFARYAVVSNFLRKRSAELGIRRVPSVVGLGLNRAKFRGPLPAELAVVGYGGAMRREDQPGVDIKRGSLAMRATEAAGLLFKPAAGYHFLAMPGYYRQVDALLVASVTEGFGLPALEAAAAGRLVISTPVGNFPSQAALGGGIVAPMDVDEYYAFVVDRLRYYKDRPAEFQEICRHARQAVERFDWSLVVDDWVDLFS